MNMKYLQQIKVFFTFIVCASILLLSNTTYAQDKVVTGVVKDLSDGSPLPGVNVLIKGTNVGTISNFDGEFTLTLTEDAQELFISYIGYKPQTIAISGRSKINVDLEVDVEQLEEVVVIGYGVQKKSVVTGAITSVKTEDITQTPVGNPAQILQGRAPGVTVTAVSGKPGAGMNIKIRGNGSNTNNSPLYVVDGVQMPDIEFLSPDDIASMEVLKDASSAAIYGSRAANGVVLITTKKGESGKATVTYNGYYGVQTPWKKAAVMNANEYMTFHNEGMLLGSGKVRYTPEQIASNTVDTDWQDEIFQSAPMQSHTIQASGGNEGNQYLASLGYYGQQGIVGGDKSMFDKYTFRLNSSHKISDSFKFGSNVTYVKDQRKGINEQSEFGGILQNALVHDPLTPVYETDEAKITEYKGMVTSPVKDGDKYYGISERGLREIANPLARIHNTFEEGGGERFLANAYLEFTPQFIKGLKLKTDFALNTGSWAARNYNPVAYYNSVNLRETSSVGQSSGRHANYQWENVLSYEKTLNEDHNFNVVLGNTVIKETYAFIGGGRTDLQLPGWEYAYLGNGAPDDQTSNAYTVDKRLLSVFGRVAYNYKEKYMFSGVVRYDGSTNFAKGNQFGVFPSFQLGWVASEEEFLKGSDVLNFLKLRAGWGQVGNENIGAFGYLASFSGTVPYPIGTDQTPQPGFALGNMANPSLQWETAEEINVGIDAGFLHDQILLNVDFYSNKRIDLLASKPIPAYAGLGAPNFNMGTVQNQGVEVALTYQKKGDEFGYAVTLNGAYNDNKVVDLANQDGRITYGGLFLMEGNLMMEEGFPMPYFYGYKTDGILQNEAEASAYNEAVGAEAVPGDIRFVDVNGDGVIDANDRTNIGTPVHNWTYGLNLSADYKGFDFSMFWQGMAGGSLINATSRPDLATEHNYPVRYLNRWTGEGSTNDFPRFTHDDSNSNFTRMNDMVHVEDASFLRLRTVQLGYTLPRHISDVVGMSRARFYISANNVFTFTKYSGMDPEVGHSAGSNDIEMGFDKGSYPQAKSVLVGLNVTF